MQKYKAELLAAAWRELDQIADIHMALVSPKSAENITDKILNAIELLEEHPLMGKKMDEPVLAGENYRNLICGNYLIFYKVVGQMVYVYHIADGRTDYPKLFEDME